MGSLEEVKVVARGTRGAESKGDDEGREEVYVSALTLLVG